MAVLLVATDAVKLPIVNGDLIGLLSVPTGARILLVAQPDPVENGVYVVDGGRADDAAVGINACGYSVYVAIGDCTWICNADYWAKFGVDAVTFRRANRHLVSTALLSTELGLMDDCNSKTFYYPFVAGANRHDMSLILDFNGSLDVSIFASTRKKWVDSSIDTIIAHVNDKWNSGLYRLSISVPIEDTIISVSVSSRHATMYACLLEFYE